MENIWKSEEKYYFIKKVFVINKLAWMFVKVMPSLVIAINAMGNFVQVKQWDGDGVSCGIHCV